MKRFFFITLFPLLLPWLCPARPEVCDSDSATIGRFERAYAEMAAMLDGRTPLSIKRAVFLAEWAYAGERLDYGRYCREIDSLAGNIREFIAANHLERFSTGGNIALFEFFTGSYSMNGHVPFEYDFEDYSGEGESVELFVTKLLRTHRGQCRSLPLLYKILADEIGAEAYIAYAPNHSFIRHRDERRSRWENVELTNGTLSREEFIIETMCITQQAIDKGTYMKPSSDRETLLELLVELACFYLDAVGYIDPIVDRILCKVLDCDPDNLRALMVCNNCLVSMLGEHKRRLMREGRPDDALIEAIVARLRIVEAEIAATGHVDMPEESHREWVRAFDEERARRGIQARKE